MKEPEFIVNPIHIDQSFFDKNLHQTEGTHAWNGCTLKIDLLIERLETSSHPYILFTDIDIIAKNNIYKNLKPHIDSDEDMVFLQEGGHLNIGFILLKVSKEVIDFWKLVKSKMVETPAHDQQYVNDLIKIYRGKWGKFDQQIFTSSNLWDCTTEFSIMQLVSSDLGKEFDLAEKIFCTAQQIEVQDYMQYVPQDIIPFIYKFQELLYQSYHAVNS
jgi:hypothetical protein